MVVIGILRKLHWHDVTLWTVESFCQPKKMKDLQIVMNFCKINESIKQHPFPLPHVIDIMQKLECFNSATALDLL